jgi:hypothetical protein
VVPTLVLVLILRKRPRKDVRAFEEAEFFEEGMTTCRRSKSDLLSPPNKPVYPPREGQCLSSRSEISGLLSYRRATARASWHGSVQTLLVQADTAGARWLLGGTTSLLPPIASQKRHFENLGDAKLTCSSGRPHANAVFPECLHAALYDGHDSENAGGDQIETQFPRSIGRDRLRIEPDK